MHGRLVAACKFFKAAVVAPGLFHKFMNQDRNFLQGESSHVEHWAIDVSGWLPPPVDNHRKANFWLTLRRKLIVRFGAVIEDLRDANRAFRASRRSAGAVGPDNV
jgi:hypothetical protein